MLVRSGDCSHGAYHGQAAGLDPTGRSVADLGAAAWQRVRVAIAPDLLVGFTATRVRQDGLGQGDPGFDALLAGPSSR